MVKSEETPDLSVALAAKQASSSFLKKRTKKLLFYWPTRPIRLTRTETNKSFLVLFFKKELLASLKRNFYAAKSPNRRRWAIRARVGGTRGLGQINRAGRGKRAVGVIPRVRGVLNVGE